MSEALELIRNAKTIRDRLRSPPNAVKDTGIDLRSKRILERIRTQEEQWDSLSKTLRVLEYQVIDKLILFTYRQHNPIGKVKIKTILDIVCEYFRLPEDSILGNCRRAAVVRPRHIFWYLVLKYNGPSMACLGRRMGKDHTTIMHARDKIQESMLVDEVLRETMCKLATIIYLKHEPQPGFPRCSLTAVHQSLLATTDPQGLVA